MLTGAGFRNYALLTHAPRQQNLAHAVVNLVGTSVTELIALEVNLGAAQMRGQAGGKIKWAGPTDIVLEIAVELGLEGWIGLRRSVGVLDLEN